MNLTIGLDLGQRRDHSALALVERLIEIKGDPTTDRQEFIDHYHVVGLKRWPLFTPYFLIVRDVCEMMRNDDDLQTLVVDVSGVGRPIGDQFNEAFKQGKMGPKAWWPRLMVITGPRTPPTRKTVPKIDLVDKLRTALDAGLLKVADDLSLGPVLRKEMQNFDAKVLPSGVETYSSAREAQHDDICLAVSLGLFRHNQGQPRVLDPATGAARTDVIRIA